MEPSAIIDLRRRRGWTQADLAARLGTDPVTVSRWERGVSRPRRSALLRLRGLADGDRSPIPELVRILGEDAAASVLKRAILLSTQPTHTDFAADPSDRLREVDRLRSEQLEMKRRSRVKR